MPSHRSNRCMQSCRPGLLHCRRNAVLDQVTIIAMENGTIKKKLWWGVCVWHRQAWPWMAPAASVVAPVCAPAPPPPPAASHWPPGCHQPVCHAPCQRCSTHHAPWPWCTNCGTALHQAAHIASSCIYCMKLPLYYQAASIA